MLVEEHFRALILAMPAVAEFIEERLRPIILRPGEKLPAATYQLISKRPDSRVLGSELLRVAVLELTLWGFDYIAMKTTIEAVTLALESMESYPIPIAALQVTNEEDVFDDKFEHADGVGLLGVRLECQLTLCA